MGSRKTQADAEVGVDSSVLSGVAEATLDDKSRVVLPARFRRGLPSSLTLWVSAERSLMVGSADAHSAAVESLSRSGSPLAAAALRLARVYVEVVTVDGQGRISVPAALIRAAQLRPGSPVLIEGHGGHLQMWDAGVRESLLELVASQVLADPSGWGELGDEITAATRSMASAPARSTAPQRRRGAASEVSTD